MENKANFEQLPIEGLAQICCKSLLQNVLQTITALLMSYY